MGNKNGTSNKNINKQLRKEKAIRRNKMQKLMGWSLAAIVLIVIVVTFVSSPSGPKAGAPVDQTVFQYEKQPTLGSKDAPVKLVEFADFKCPACMQFDKTILPELKKDYIDTGVVQLSFINYPIISPETDSRTAAIAGEAVFNQNPEEFWKFYEAVYAHQGDERKLWATPEYLVQIAKDSKVEVDYDKLLKDITDKTFGQEVRDDESIARKIGVHGTPTLYINGQPVPENDTFNYNAIRELIEQSKGETGK
jgi:protein-disulfide isomerase